MNARPLPLLAALLYNERFAADGVLADLAASLAASGRRLAGVIQVNDTYDALCPCDMTLQDLASGRTFRISQRLGRYARGCRLNPQALADSVALVEAKMPMAEVLILNKFGKAEAAGGGFRAVIAAALADNKPVLVGLSATNRAAFEDFAGEFGCICTSVGDLTAWLDAHGIRATLAA